MAASSSRRAARRHDRVGLAGESGHRAHRTRRHGRSGILDRCARAASIHRGHAVLDVSPTSAVIATAGPDHDAALWDMEVGREIARLTHEAA
jgi:WD40 repeat protein